MFASVMCARAFRLSLFVSLCRFDGVRHQAMLVRQVPCAARTSGK
jgi:hypothetical protein